MNKIDTALARIRREVIETDEALQLALLDADQPDIQYLLGREAGLRLALDLLKTQGLT